MNNKQRGTVFNDGKGNFYVRTAVLVNDTTYSRSASMDAPKITNKKDTIVVFAGECKERREEGRKRLYSFRFPDGQTFPLWEDEFLWSGKVTVDDKKRYDNAIEDIY